MGRGLGVVQQQVLAELDSFHDKHGPYAGGGPQWLVLHGLLNTLCPGQDPARREAIRRAVRTLAGRGMVTTGRAGGMVVLQRVGRDGPRRLSDKEETRVDNLLASLTATVQGMLADVGSNRRLHVTTGDYRSVHRVLDPDTGRVHGFPHIT